MRSKLIRQIVLFAFVGVVSTAIDYGTFILLAYKFNINYIVASTLSYSAGILFNYVASMKYVFDGRAERSKSHEFFLYVVLTLIGLGLNQLVLFVSVDWLRVSKALGKIIATALVLVYNFVSRKLFIE